MVWTYEETMSILYRGQTLDMVELWRRVRGNPKQIWKDSINKDIITVGTIEDEVLL